MENLYQSVDGREYRGYRNPSETLCTIKWCYQDLMELMASRGIELTDENIDRIEGCRLEKTMQDRSIEEGWQILDDIVSMAIRTEGGGFLGTETNLD